jgi:hypothetical protein
MALRAFRTVTSETSAFEAAKARWTEVSAARGALRDKLDGCRAALAFADHRPAPGEHFPPLLEDRARRYLDGRTPNRDRLARQLAEIEDELAQAAERYGREAEAWRMAVENEARRRAEALRPRHRAAVKQMGKAVEELSRAIEAERAIRAGLGEVGSTALPDASREFGSLHEYNVSARWRARRVKPSTSLFGSPSIAASSSRAVADTRRLAYRSGTAHRRLSEVGNREVSD